jgi:hypothetical protein
VGIFTIYSASPGLGAIRAERILRIQGYSNPARVRPAIVRAAQAMAELACAKSAPVVAYRDVPIVALEKDVLELHGGARMHCLAFERQLQGCSAVCVFVLTLGPAISDEVVRLTDAGDLLEAVLLETAGWLCIEEATRRFKSQVREQALVRGERITSRMGPGYSYKIGSRTGEWRLEEQSELFRALGDAAPLPVRLLPSGAMTPKMSRSGLYGLAPLATPSRVARIDGAEQRSPIIEESR